MGAKPSKAPPPPPPPCSTYLSGTGETEMRAYSCDGYRADCTSYLCNDIETKRHNFCSNPENWLKNPGGGTCQERDTGKTEGKAYCAVGDRIKTSGSCTYEWLGDIYHELAETYCKTANGQADPWCSCYNVINKVCDTNLSAAGCLDKAISFDPLYEATPEEFKTAWAGLEPCYGGVCQGNKYIVPNANQNCNKPIKICKQELDAQNISESSVEMVCNLGEDTRDTRPIGDGSREVVFQEGSLQDTLDKNFRSKLPFGIGDFIPLSFEDAKYNRNKQIGLGTSLSSSFSSVLIIAIIITLLATTGTKRRIFRG
jgi:hypothetical protein